MAPSVGISLAGPHDILSILDLMVETCRDPNFSFYPPPQEIPMIRFLTDAVASRYPPIIAKTEEGVLVGCLHLHADHFPWNPDIYFLYNALFTVHRDYRKLKIAELLIQKAKKIAEGARLDLHVNVMGMDKVELKDRFVQMQGARYVGGNLIFAVSI